MQRVLAGLEGLNIKLIGKCDVNGDGDANMKDMILVAKSLLAS